MPGPPIAPCRRYDSAMATIQVRDLDSDVVEKYRNLARLEGKSLQQYMKELLSRQVLHSVNADVFIEVERSGLLRESSVTLDDIVADIRQVRDQA